MSTDVCRFVAERSCVNDVTLRPRHGESRDAVTVAGHRPRSTGRRDRRSSGGGCCNRRAPVASQIASSHSIAATSDGRRFVLRLRRGRGCGGDFDVGRRRDRAPAVFNMSVTRPAIIRPDALSGGLGEWVGGNRRQRYQVPVVLSVKRRHSVLHGPDR